MASLRSGGIEGCGVYRNLDDEYLICEQVSWEKRRRKACESARLSITWTVQCAAELLWGIQHRLSPGTLSGGPSFCELQRLWPITVDIKVFLFSIPWRIEQLRQKGQWHILVYIRQ